jgi:hypothetical protein
LAPVFYIDSTLYDSPYLFWKILGGKQGQNFQKNEWLLHLQILTFFEVVKTTSITAELSLTIF